VLGAQSEIPNPRGGRGRGGEGTETTIAAGQRGEQNKEGKAMGDPTCGIKTRMGSNHGEISIMV